MQRTCPVRPGSPRPCGRSGRHDRRNQGPHQWPVRVLPPPTPPRPKPLHTLGGQASSSFALLSPYSHAPGQHTDLSWVGGDKNRSWLEPEAKPCVDADAVAGNGSSPAVNRAPRAGRALTIESLAWPQAGLSSSGGRAPKSQAERCGLQRYARICPGRAAPAGHGGGCGGTRSRLRSRSLRKTATDLPARLHLTTIKAGRWSGGLFATENGEQRRRVSEDG